MGRLEVYRLGVALGRVVDVAVVVAVVAVVVQNYHSSTCKTLVATLPWLDLVEIFSLLDWDLVELFGGLL